MTRASPPPTREPGEPRPAPPMDWPDLNGLDDPAKLRARVARVPHWFHSLDLPGGVRTQGVYRPAEKLDRIGLPGRLDGMSVLDVGAWDGFYSFECERRGAASVTSADLWDPGQICSGEGYAVAHTALGSRARPVRVSVHDLDPAVHARYDLVLFLGVLYHLTDPLGALFALRRVTRGTLIVETASDFAFARRPAVAFYPGASLGGDASNQFAPNAAALRAMCLEAGFRDARVFWSMGLPARTARAVRRRGRFGEGLLAGLSRGRIVVHATV